MRYTLTIKNNDGKTVVVLSYNLWAQARECAELLYKGVAEDFTYNIQIYDNNTKSVVYNQNTY